MDSTLFFWLLPIAFLLLIAIRLLKKPTKIDDLDVSINEGNSGTKKKGNRVGIYILIFLLIAVGVIVVVQQQGGNGTKSKIECLTKICPEDFNEVIRGTINERAGLFHSKGFSIIENDNDLIFTDNGYNNSDFKYELKRRRISEYGKIEKNNAAVVLYVILDKNKYKDFFENLKKSGAEKINIKKYIDHEIYVFGDYDTYRYKSCLFTDYDYMFKEKGFIIGITDYDKMLFNDSIQRLRLNN